MTVSLPLPSIRLHSVVRICPPTSVHASPIAAPISFFLSACRSRNFHGPSSSGTFTPSTMIFSIFSFFLPPWALTTWRAILRHTLPISRSRLRTPASRE